MRESSGLCRMHQGPVQTVRVRKRSFPSQVRRAKLTPAPRDLGNSTISVSARAWCSRSTGLVPVLVLPLVSWVSFEVIFSSSPYEDTWQVARNDFKLWVATSNGYKWPYPRKTCSPKTKRRLHHCKLRWRRKILPWTIPLETGLSSFLSLIKSIVQFCVLGRLYNGVCYDVLAGWTSFQFRKSHDSMMWIMLWWLFRIEYWIAVASRWKRFKYGIKIRQSFSPNVDYTCFLGIYISHPLPV